MVYFNGNINKFRIKIQEDFKIPKGIVDNIVCLYTTEEQIKECSIYCEIDNTETFDIKIYSDILSKIGFNEENMHIILKNELKNVVMFVLSNNNKAVLFRLVDEFLKNLKRNNLIMRIGICLRIPGTVNSKFTYYESRIYHFLKTLFAFSGIVGEVEFDANNSVSFESLKTIILYSLTNKNKIKIRVQNLSDLDKLSICDNLSRDFIEGDLHINAGEIMSLIEV